MFADPINEALMDVLRLCRQMLQLAERGDALRRDAGCGVVFGTLRDDAYKVRRLAERELEKHGHANRSMEPALNDKPNDTRKKEE